MDSMLNKSLLSILLVCVAFFANAADSMKKEVIVSGVPQNPLPLSRAVEYNGLVFVSGQIASDLTTGKLTQGGIEVQTKQILDNIVMILKAANTDTSKVLKVNIFVKNIDDFNTVNEIYGTYFSKPYPTRTFVEVARLPRDVLIEIEVIAHK